MADAGSDIPEGLPLLKLALQVTGNLATDEELEAESEEESEEETSDELEAPEEIEAPEKIEAPENIITPEHTAAAKGAEFISYSPVSRFPPGGTSQN